MARFTCYLCHELLLHIITLTLIIACNLCESATDPGNSGRHMNIENSTETPVVIVVVTAIEPNRTKCKGRKHVGLSSQVSHSKEEESIYNAQRLEIIKWTLRKLQLGQENTGIGRNNRKDAGYSALSKFKDLDK